jgi:hypothetical protein
VVELFKGRQEGTRKGKGRERKETKKEIRKDGQTVEVRERREVGWAPVGALPRGLWSCGCCCCLGWRRQ